jgi:hypothetical protein
VLKIIFGENHSFPIEKIWLNTCITQFDSAVKRFLVLLEVPEKCKMLELDLPVYVP